ncbi:MAG: DUF6537 domain-containing protein, partial [Caldimonas sp.]
ALLRAIELNGVQVDNNKAAFEWGRRAAHDLASVQALLKPAQVIGFVRKSVDLDAMVAQRVEFLTAYQNPAYAADYKSCVDKVRAAEAPLGTRKLAEAVARYLFKLMAYKDEYEVARLHTETGFLDKIASQFEGDYKVHYHLAPPALAKRNADGELVKQKFGPWMHTAFKVLARLKGLRGTAFDPFGRSEERRTERALIGEYRASIDEVVAALNPSNLALATEIARIPEEIRGYGHVKERHLRLARPKWDALMAEWRSGGQRRAA